MTRTRQLLDPLRLVARWLVVMSVFFGLAGLGSSSAFASASKACGASCPCDEEADEPELQTGHVDSHEQHNDSAPCDDDHDVDDDHVDDDCGHDGDAPSQDECPDDCPNCGCCLAIALAVLPLPVTSSAPLWVAVPTSMPVDAPATGTCSGVFRPPRSRA